MQQFVRGTNGWDLIQAGKLDLKEDSFEARWTTVWETSTHIHDVASGEHEGIDPDAMHANSCSKTSEEVSVPNVVLIFARIQCFNGESGRDSASEVVSMQLEASMETSLIQVAAHYINVMQAMQDERDDAVTKLSKGDPAAIEEKLRKKLEKSIHKELEREYEQWRKNSEKGSKCSKF